MPKRWTDQEITYLKSVYPRKGAQHVANHLNRPVYGVRHQVRKHGLSLVPNGYVALAWVAPKPSNPRIARDRAITRARQDGVLLERPYCNQRYCVPESWADKYANEVGDAIRADQRQHWLTSNDIADMTGLLPNSVTHLLQYNEGIGRYLQDVERCVGWKPSFHYRFHPQQARMAINAWRAQKRAA